MEKLEYRMTMDAPREKVWNILWGDATYPVWTGVFSENSRVETDWQEGSKVLFLGGGSEGLVSSIAANVPHEFMSFKHLGTIKDGVEDYDSEQTKQWAGSHENYTLKTVDGKTELVVDLDVTEQDKDYFGKAWPKAMEKLKQLAEQG
ncbi:SRPBCC domain-containing protein [Larkinella rosea]|uniref:SRPBCC domain-containing protein n=1 Tax=Larkinella rosea TaxID=2025312 RepID=A0A3P1BUR3_9BACT|nr:SRPBCC domain-containing protein [Larkinella rosea]RRB04294.1 SRPBCC domain-containing protein [Larkinella rosea]